MKSYKEWGELVADMPVLPDFFIIGEMHGSRQNAGIIRELAELLAARGRPSAIAFEWRVSSGERNALRDYIRGATVPAIPTFFFDSDGRVTSEHISLLAWIREHNARSATEIDLHTFDEPSAQDDTERALADSLIGYKTAHPGTIIIVETGNIHARKASSRFSNKEYLPMAAQLMDTYEVFSVFLKYLRGTVNVDGQKLNVTDSSSQQEGPGVYFDALMEVPCSEAASNIDLLTKLSD